MIVELNKNEKVINNIVYAQKENGYFYAIRVYIDEMPTMGDLVHLYCDIFKKIYDPRDPEWETYSLFLASYFVDFRYVTVNATLEYVYLINIIEAYKSECCQSLDLCFGIWGGDQYRTAQYLYRDWLQTRYAGRIYRWVTTNPNDLKGEWIPTDREFINNEYHDNILEVMNSCSLCDNFYTCRNNFYLPLFDDEHREKARKAEKSSGECESNYYVHVLKKSKVAETLQLPEQCTSTYEDYFPYGSVDANEIYDI